MGPALELASRMEEIVGYGGRKLMELELVKSFIQAQWSHTRVSVKQLTVEVPRRSIVLRTMQ